MIREVRYLDPAKYNQGIRKVKRVIPQKEAQRDFWRNALSADGPKVEGTARPCLRCRDTFIHYSNSNSAYCIDCREIRKKEKRKKRQLELYGNKPCDQCGTILSLERATRGGKRCSEACDKLAYEETKRLSVQRQNEQRKKAVKRENAVRKMTAESRAAMRKRKGIVCLECGGEIPPETRISAKFCKEKCQKTNNDRGRKWKPKKKKSLMQSTDD